MRVREPPGLPDASSPIAETRFKQAMPVTGIQKNPGLSHRHAESLLVCLLVCSALQPGDLFIPIS